MLKLIRLPEVMDRVGLSRSTIYMYIQQGRFSKNIKLGTRTVAWNSEEIDDWIQEKIDQSRSND
jgi:prophage regulatory protein